MSFKERRVPKIVRPGSRSIDAVLPPQPDTAGLHRLIYTSEASAPGDDTGAATVSAREIAAISGPKNAARGLSGILISVQNHFIQVLEGESAELELVFECICCDMRHRDLRLIDFSPSADRCFTQWDMVPLDASLLDDPEPLEDFFMSIRGGMAPAAILSKIQEFLQEIS